MRYYFSGIKGSGMSALASMLFDLKNEVIGYDDNKEETFTQIELNKRNIFIDYNLEKLEKDMIFIYTSAIHENHPSYIKAKKLKLEMLSYYEAVGKLSKNFETISICGCHGKTTTTALLSNIFKNTAYGANYLIGDGTGVIDADSKLFFLESCEYQRHFLEYNPKYIIITNIELDHIDYYKDLKDYISAYQEFINKDSCKKVIACGDDSNILNLDSDKIITYGIKPHNNILAKNIIYNDNGSSFDVYIFNKFFSHFDISLYGQHMLLNTLACIGISYLFNLPSDIIKSNIKDFKGAKRRFKEEIIGNNVLIDDYAHHPTEVEVTIKAARQKYPNKKIIAILKIHTLSRAKKFKDEFIKALNLADISYVMDIYNDREDPKLYPGIDHNIIIKGLNNGHYINEDIVEELLKYDDAVICFLSSKNIDILENKYKKLTEKL